MDGEKLKWAMSRGMEKLQNILNFMSINSISHIVSAYIYIPAIAGVIGCDTEYGPWNPTYLLAEDSQKKMPTPFLYTLLTMSPITSSTLPVLRTFSPFSPGFFFWIPCCHGFNMSDILALLGLSIDLSLWHKHYSSKSSIWHLIFLHLFAYVICRFSIK